MRLKQRIRHQHQGSMLQPASPGLGNFAAQSSKVDAYWKEDLRGSK